MKVLLHPGGALLILALVAFLVWLVTPSIWVIGGVVRLLAFFTMVFGIVGGAFLTFFAKKAETSQ
ncbi:MAG: hypothetical protein HKN03_00645 [Acidimicrobiales bacterium]|nr:hypothetical protein [Acidimicrobiales bacterium]